MLTCTRNALRGYIYSSHYILYERMEETEKETGKREEKRGIGVKKKQALCHLLFPCLI